MQEATQMTMDEFFCYQEQTFDSFSKRVIKNIGIDLHNKQKALADIEVAFSALPKREMDSLFTEDTYLLGSEGTTFLVLGTPVTISDPLGQALYFLPPQRRKVLLLFYFAGKSEPQIGHILNITAAAVNYRKKKALDTLRDILEAMESHET